MSYEIESFHYDTKAGQVQTAVDGVIREAIMVRQGLEDQLVLEAIVLELRRRGYIVLSPLGQDCDECDDGEVVSYDDDPDEDL